MPMWSDLIPEEKSGLYYFQRVHIFFFFFFFFPMKSARIVLISPVLCERNKIIHYHKILCRLESCCISSEHFLHYALELTENQPP